MPEFHFSLLLPLALLLLAACSAAALSWFVYRVTVPPIAKPLNYVLTSLRAFGLFLTFLLLGEPLLSIVTRTVEPPVITVLLDNSKSMALNDPKGKRKQAVSSRLQSMFDKLVSGKPRYGFFAGDVRWFDSFSSDSLKLDGDMTDIASAMKSVKDKDSPQNVQAVLLVSDGNSTVDSNPLHEAEELGIPVFVVGVGDTSELKDLLIRKTLTNDITYVGNTVPVTVTIRSSGFEGQRVELLLRDGSTVLDRKMVTLEKGIRDYEIPLSFVPAREGLQKFTVELSHLPDELTEKNNRSSFFTKVLKSKMRVALIAGGPGPDVAFIRRALEGDKNIEVKALVERGNGQFYNGASGSLEDFDCLVLVGFPSRTTSGGFISTVAGALNSGKPVLSILSRGVDFGKLRVLETALPFTIMSSSADEFQAFMAVPETQRTNAIMKLTGKSEGFERWAKLPPIFKAQLSVRTKPESEVLATTRIQNTVMSEPFLLSRSLNGRKSLALLGYGVWRWKLLADAGSGGETVLDEFLSGAVRWLTTREDEKQVRIQPARQMFSTQEAVEFTGQVYDQSFQPIENAQVNVSVQRGRQSNELTLSPVGNGRYEGSLSILEEGDYTYTARVAAGNKLLAEQRGTFSVGGFNAEFLETRLNRTLLQTLATRTGGKYYDLASMDAFPDDLKNLANFQPHELVRSHEIQLWNIAWILGLIVSTFAAEWFLRKRSGML